MNKLKGKHNNELDEAEYIRIIRQGEKASLKALLESVSERLPETVDGRESSVAIPRTWEIIVECKDEAEQRSVFEKLASYALARRFLRLIRTATAMPTAISIRAIMIIPPMPASWFSDVVSGAAAM